MGLTLSANSTVRSVWAKPNFNSHSFDLRRFYFDSFSLVNQNVFIALHFTFLPEAIYFPYYDDNIPAL
jgi:hypothetical protein